MLADEIPVALIGLIGMYLGLLSTSAYLDLSVRQKAKDIPKKEQLLLFAGGLGGLVGGVYVGSKVIL